jgi:hypothetical protein
MDFLGIQIMASLDKEPFQSANSLAQALKV